MIQVSGIVTADNSNILANTDLQTAPADGVLEVYIASTQADTIIDISSPGVIAGKQVKPQLRANGVPELSNDSPYSLVVSLGQQLIVKVDVVTSATVGYVIRHFDLDELS